MTLEEAVKLSPSERYDYPDVFSDDCGLDIQFPKENLKAIKSWEDKRRVTLDITTFIGISSNAIHYYGMLNVQGVYMKYDDEKGYTTNIFSLNKPLANYVYQLRLKRIITKDELENDLDRWGDFYDEGDLVNNFETIEEIIALATDIFKLRFSGEWDFFIESPIKKYNGKLNIN